MSSIRTNAAAAMLSVSPNTLRSWEQRFGYPKPQRTEGGHRQFELREIEALRQAFEETQNISSAISLARERGEGPSSATRLRSALSNFDEQKADRLLEESLALRSVERTVQSVLLPAVQMLSDQTPPASGHSLTDGAKALSLSPEYCFAWRYATGWLAAIQRVAPPATRDEGVLIFDAGQPICLDALYVQALELFLRRQGLRVLTLPVELESTRIGNAMRALQPTAVVLGGSCALEVIGRLVYAARQAHEGLTVFDYRGALPQTAGSTVDRLSDNPCEAAEYLRERLTTQVRDVLGLRSFAGATSAS